MKKLADVFDPKLNALNAVRLSLAVGVIAYHSFPISGAESLRGPIKQLTGNFFVDAFFAVSGYLIFSSWVRRPKLWQFLQARLLRIIPAFWICLIVTAGVFAPISVLLSGQAWTWDRLEYSGGYVLSNSLLRVQQYGIPGTLEDVPFPEVWNGSMWTLWWEFLCYLGVLALGLSRVLRWRTTVVLCFCLALGGLVITAYGPISQYYLNNGSRFGLMFLAGAVIYTFQDKLPANWFFVSVSSAFVIASAWLPDYRLVAALPIAYLVIVSASLLKHRRLKLENDISYGTYIYAFPLQQLLASAGLYKLGVAAFATLSIAVTLPIAAASWFLVERQALRLKNRRSLRVAPEEVAPQPQG